MTDPVNNFICYSTCRICLEKDTHTIDLFYQSDKSVNIINKIYECFGIKLAYKKHFPSSICKQCMEEVYVAWKFRQKCIHSEEKFALLGKNYDVETLHTKETPGNVIEDCNSVDILNYSNKIDNVGNLDTDQCIDAKNPLKCKHCNKSLKNESCLLKHNKLMHQKRKHVGIVTGFGANRQYNCTKCSYATPHRQTLINHMRRHNGERPYCCDCGKSFTQSSSLAAHRKTHSDITYYTCSICGKQFKHAYSLKTHSYVHEVGQFSCSICKKLLKSKRSHQAHMQRHYNIYNYSCEDCGSTFVTCSELLNHRKKHSLEKNFECHVCGYKTQIRKNLVIHLKRHAGEKLYKCEFCALSFYTRSDLLRHKRVHSREKPFTCLTCGQRFTYSSSLNKHMQNVHGIEYKWAEVKQKETRIMKLVITEKDTKKNNKINMDYKRILF